MLSGCRRPEGAAGEDVCWTSPSVFMAELNPRCVCLCVALVQFMDADCLITVTPP